MRTLVVPGSYQIKKAAEAEGLDKIFREAGGAEWREAGCSMCLAMNGDQLEPGQTSVAPAIEILKDVRAKVAGRSSLRP